MGATEAHPHLLLASSLALHRDFECAADVGTDACVDIELYHVLCLRAAAHGHQIDGALRLRQSQPTCTFGRCHLQLNLRTREDSNADVLATQVLERHATTVCVRSDTCADLHAECSAVYELERAPVQAPIVHRAELQRLLRRGLLAFD